MRYATGGAFRAALEARLHLAAQERGQTVGRLRKIVVFDRLLARLAAVAPGRWVLKGGFALELRLDQRARATRDLDLDRGDSEEDARADLQAAANAELGDLFDFQVERVRAGEEIGPGGGVRYRATAFLGGRPFDVVTVDIGFLDPLAAAPDLLTGPDLLRFAGIPPATIPVAPLEQQVAEKVHAYTRTYGRGEASSRPRDLIDLVLIAELAEFEASRLREAIERTFAARATHELSGELPPPPEDWARAYRRLAEEVGLDPDLSVGFEAARAFVEPVLTPSPAVRRWVPTARGWRS